MNVEERQKLALYLLSNPAKSYPVVAREKGVSAATVARIAQEFSIVRPVGRKTPLIIAATPTSPVIPPVTPEAQ